MPDTDRDRDHDRLPLAEAEVFRGLAEPELAALAALAQRRRYAEGERLFALGEEARALLVIAAGTVALTIPIPIRDRIDDVTLEEKRAGAVIAWSALVPPHRFTLGAKARSEVELHCFDRDRLAALFEASPRLHLVVTANLNRIIASRVSLLEALVARDVQRLVAEYPA